jgi:hypothetical protein
MVHAVSIAARVAPEAVLVLAVALIVLVVELVAPLV